MEYYIINYISSMDNYIFKEQKSYIIITILTYDFFTPIYNILDQKIFVEIFGCGCVPSAQTNMFNIDFNANDLRLIVYNILAICITFLGLFLSRKIESKKLKIIYVLTILVFNILLAYKICQLYMWA